MKPLLVLYCGAGGMDTGLSRAGFTRIVGVDNRLMRRYPFTLVVADALAVLDTWDLSRFCAIVASPPCQDHSVTRNFTVTPEHGSGWLLAATRERLQRSGLPWVIENVPGAPMRTDYIVCGCMFPGLRTELGMLQRERWFETSWRGFQLRQPCHHDLPAISVCGHDVPSHQRKFGRSVTLAERKQVMGIDWMSRDEMGQAVPPAFGEYMGRELRKAIGE